MKNGVFTIFLLFGSSILFGAGSQNLTPTAVGCMPGGICYIVVDPNITMTACPNTGQLRLDMSLPGASYQYSAALSALMGNKEINAFVTDECAGGYSISPSWLHVIK